jgi:hypothetical protein
MEVFGPDPRVGELDPILPYPIRAQGKGLEPRLNLTVSEADGTVTYAALARGTRSSCKHERIVGYARKWIGR